jgi:hypothetical protein
MNEERRKEFMQLTKHQLIEIIFMLEEVKIDEGIQVNYSVNTEFDIVSFFEGFYEDCQLKPKSRLKLKKFVDKYDLEKVIECIEIAVLHYDKYDNDKMNFNEAYKKLGGILYNKYGDKTSDQPDLTTRSI